MPATSRADAIAALTAPGARYELASIATANGSQRVFTNAPATLRDLFTGTASDRPFIVFEDERLTFAEAYRSASTIAQLLVADYSIGTGDRVAISMRNYPEWILAFTAITSIGAIAVAMNALWQPEEMEFGLRDSGARVLVADQERRDQLAAASGSLDVQVLAVRSDGPLGAAVPLAARLTDLGDWPMPPASIAPTDPATIFYTSGSTGHPKGVVSTHRNIISALLSWELDTFATAAQSGHDPMADRPRSERPVQDAALLAVPLFHVTGSHAVYLLSYRAQRKVVCMYKWDPEEAAALIERERVNSFIAPPAMTGDLVRIARQTQHA